MDKYYFKIRGLCMNLKNEKEADNMCIQIQSILEKFGVKNTEVLFSTEKEYLKENYNG